MTFDEQFKNRVYFDTPFGRLETLDLIPESIKDAIPVLFAPGWGETPELEKEVLREIFNTGRKVVTIRHARKIQKSEQAHDFPLVEIQKAETLVLFLQAKKIKTIDVITHSEGAINVSIAAVQNPQLFKAILLVTPAGLIGPVFPGKILVGFLMHLLQTNTFALVKANNKYPQKEQMTVKQKFSSLLQEIVAIASTDICPLLEDLKEKGVHIGILAGEKDTVFPAKEMKAHMLSHVPELLGEDGVFQTKPGGHELYANTHNIMNQVMTLLDKLSE